MNIVTVFILPAIFITIIIFDVSVNTSTALIDITCVYIRSVELIRITLCLRIRFGFIFITTTVIMEIFMCVYVVIFFVDILVNVIIITLLYALLSRLRTCM